MSTELDEVWNEAFAEGYAVGYLDAGEALADVAELVRHARCDLQDPALRMAWGRKRKALLDTILEAAS